MNLNDQIKLTYNCLNNLLDNNSIGLNGFEINNDFFIEAVRVKNKEENKKLISIFFHDERNTKYIKEILSDDFPMISIDMDGNLVIKNPSILDIDDLSNWLNEIIIKLI